MRLAALLLIALLAAGAPARADDEACSTAMARWQPREALRQRLEAAGWQVQRVVLSGGCYLATGLDASGKPVKAWFDPGTLARVRPGDREDDGQDD